MPCYVPESCYQHAGPSLSRILLILGQEVKLGFFLFCQYKEMAINPLNSTYHLPYPFGLLVPCEGSPVPSASGPSRYRRLPPHFSSGICVVPRYKFTRAGSGSPVRLTSTTTRPVKSNHKGNLQTG